MEEAMAQRTLVQLIDDLDGTPIESGQGRAVEFAFDGNSYVIDLSDEHIEGLRNALADYVAAARKASSRAAGRSTGTAPRTPKEDLAAIRDWASKNGYTVSSRGRIAQEIRDAYDAAH